MRELSLTALVTIGCLAVCGCRDNGTKTPPGAPVAPAGKAAYSAPVFTNAIGMRMVRIEPGSFLMGSPPGEQGRNKDEGPRHRVKMTQAFYISAHEVTQAQYEKVMGANPSQFVTLQPSVVSGPGSGGNWPVVT